MQDGTVLAYVRVSTEEQAVNGVGLDAQRATINAEAARRGWSGVVFIEDAGISAKDMRRPGLAQARDLMRRGEATVLIVSAMDRLSRSLVDFVTILGEAGREGWTLVALDCPVDPSTPTGEAMLSMRAVFAQWERRVTGQRIKDALAVKKAQGVRIGRPRAIPDVVMERIVRERASGRTLQSIADGLNMDGTPTAHGGSCWHPSTVRYAAQKAAAACP